MFHHSFLANFSLDTRTVIIGLAKGTTLQREPADPEVRETIDLLVRCSTSSSVARNCIEHGVAEFAEFHRRHFEKGLDAYVDGIAEKLIREAKSVPPAVVEKIRRGHFEQVELPALPERDREEMEEHARERLDECIGTEWEHLTGGLQ